MAPSHRFPSEASEREIIGNLVGEIVSRLMFKAFVEAFLQRYSQEGRDENVSYVNLRGWALLFLSGLCATIFLFKPFKDL